MALTVEDGSRVAGADAYISLADADSYFDARANATWAALADPAKEAALRRATDFMGQRYRARWKGVRVSSTQALDWPRAYVKIDPYFMTSDAIVDPLTGGFWLAADVVPECVRRACAELAVRASAAELAPDEGPQVRSKQVGPIAVEYAVGARGATAFVAVDRMLQEVIHDRQNSVRVVRA